MIIYNILCYSSYIIALVISVLILLFYKKSKKMVICFTPIISWLYINFCLNLCFQYKMYLINCYDDFSEMPADILEIAQSSFPTGASLVFGLFFGYAYIPIIIFLLMPIKFIFEILEHIIAKARKRNS